MKHIFTTTAFLLGGMLVQASPLPFGTVEQTKELMKQQQKPGVVLWHWTKDIGKDGEITEATWKQVAQAELPVVLGQFDESVPLEKGNRSNILPVEMFNLPVAVVMAPDGTFMACIERADAMDSDKAIELIKRTVAKQEKFMQLVSKARQTPGVEGARAAGQALAMLRPGDAARHRELTNLVNNKDPEDATGYRSIYGLEHMGMYREINKILQGGADGKKKGDQRDFDAADAYVRKALANKGLKGERRQQWLSGQAYILRERIKSQPGTEKDFAPLAKAYKEIAKINPKSEYGKGAAHLAKYWDKDAFFTIKEGSYDQRYQCRYPKEWHVDMSKSMRGAAPGVYTFTLVPRIDSAMESRNFRLVVNGKEVAKADVDPQKNTKTVDFTVTSPIPKKAKVEVWLTTKCNDGWLGSAGYFEMKKKS